MKTIPDEVGCRQALARWRVAVLILVASLAPPAMLRAADARVFEGVKLDGLRQVQQYGDMPEIFELDPATGCYWLSEATIQLPLDGTWITYNLKLKKFYLNKVPGENEASYFGPIKGDPFAMFKLEERYIAKFREGHAPDEESLVRLMTRSGLWHQALRIMKGALAPDIKESVRAFHVATFHELLEGQQGDVVAPVLAAMQQTEQAIADHTVVPDDQYSPGNDALEKQGKLADWMKPSVAVPDSAWGEPVNGLRAAAVFSTVTPAVWGNMDVWLMVENASDHAIKLSSSEVTRNPHLVVKGADGSGVAASWLHAMGRDLNHHKLQPKERLTLAKRRLVFGPIPAHGFGEDGRVIAGAGEYRVRYEGLLGNATAKGEWGEWRMGGQLTTGETKITVGEKQAALKQ